MIPRSDEEDMAKTRPSALNSDLLPCILPKLKLWGPVELVDKNYEILKKISLKNKESMKKNGSQFRGWMREIWPKQAQVLNIQTCSYELLLNRNFGDRLSRLRKKLKF